jgi:hypothetical protein
VSSANRGAKSQERGIQALDRMAPADAGAANQAYSKEIEDTITAVSRLLRARWPAAEFGPYDDHLYDLAVWVHALRTSRRIRGQPQKPKITRLQSSAKKFLSELRAHRRAFLDTLQSDAHEPFYKPYLAQISAAEDAVAVFLGRPKPLNEATEMGSRLFRTCERAGLPLAPGVKDGDPYCALVTDLLALGGVYKEPATVSDMLRDRAHRARSGRGAQKRAKTALRPAG